MIKFEDLKKRIDVNEPLNTQFIIKMMMTIHTMIDEEFAIKRTENPYLTLPSDIVLYNWKKYRHLMQFGKPIQQYYIILDTINYWFSFKKNKKKRSVDYDTEVFLKIIYNYILKLYNELPEIIEKRKLKAIKDEKFRLQFEKQQLAKQVIKEKTELRQQNRKLFRQEIIDNLSVEEHLVYDILTWQKKRPFITNKISSDEELSNRLNELLKKYN